MNTQPRIHYARAEIPDFLPIAALDKIAWQATEHGEFLPDGEHVWRIWVEEAIVFCAKHDGHIIGAAIAFPCRGDQRYFLHKLFVAAEWRAQGIGKHLLGLVVEELECKCAECFLTVNPANHRAIALYKQFGFEEQRLVPGFYRAYEDRWILTRPWLPFRE